MVIFNKGREQGLIVYSQRSTVHNPLMKIRLQDSRYMMQDMGVKDRRNDGRR